MALTHEAKDRNLQGLFAIIHSHVDCNNQNPKLSEEKHTELKYVRANNSRGSTLDIFKLSGVRIPDSSSCHTDAQSVASYKP